MALRRLCCFLKIRRATQSLSKRSMHYRQIFFYLQINKRKQQLTLMRRPSKAASPPGDSGVLEAPLLGILKELLPQFRTVSRLPWSQITDKSLPWRLTDFTLQSWAGVQTFLNCSLYQFHLCKAPELITQTFSSVTLLSLLQLTHACMHMSAPV